MTSRRGFLGTLLGGAVAVANPEPLWTPGRKLISIPKLFRPRSGNQLLTLEFLTNDMLEVLRKNSIRANRINREFAVHEGLKIGSTLEVRRPRLFSADGRNLR